MRIVLGKSTNLLIFQGLINLQGNASDEEWVAAGLTSGSISQFAKSIKHRTTSQFTFDIEGAVLSHSVSRCCKKLRVIGTTLLHYRVIDNLGSGGMGVVLQSRRYTPGTPCRAKASSRGHQPQYFRLRTLFA
jgi:hypothetical protein